MVNRHSTCLLCTLDTITALLVCRGLSDPAVLQNALKTIIVSDLVAIHFLLQSSKLLGGKFSAFLLLFWYTGDPWTLNCYF